MISDGQVIKNKKQNENKKKIHKHFLFWCNIRYRAFGIVGGIQWDDTRLYNISDLYHKARSLKCQRRCNCARSLFHHWPEIKQQSSHSLSSVASKSLFRYSLSISWEFISISLFTTTTNKTWKQMLFFRTVKKKN